MSLLYLTPASIGYLTQFVLAFAIGAYFWYLACRPWREEHHARQTLLLAAAFSAFACATLLLFLNTSLHPDLRFYAIPPESVAVALFLVFFLQFAYRFPAPAPHQKWEARVVLGLTVLYALWEGGFAVHRYAMLAQGIVRYRPPAADFPLAVGFLWMALVFLRQTLRASPGERGAGVWRKVWRPGGRAARATRALALLSAMPLGIEVVDLLKDYLGFPNSIAELILSLGILFTLSTFTLIYLYYLPATTSFMVKLVGISLATILAFLGSVGWIVGPAYVAAYHNDSFMGDRQTLRFTPNLQGGYDVAAASFHFEDDWGADLGSADPIGVELPFDFPFYGRAWRQAYVSRNGAVSLGQALSWRNVLYRYGPTPALFPLAVDLAPADSPTGGLFAQSRADKLIVTWNRLPEISAPQRRYTFQLALHPDGVFEFTYKGLPATQAYATYDPRGAAWLIGAVPGFPETVPRHVRFATDRPESGGPSGLVEDYYLDFRGYLHRLLLPLAYLIIGGSALIVLSFPVFFRLNLVRPLDSLLEGVRQVNAGNLAVTMPVQHRDEIGFLTQSFNHMAAQLQTRTLASRRRTVELEALARVSSALRRAVTTEEMVSILIEETVKVVGAQAATLLLLEDGRLLVVGSHGLPPTLLGQRLPPGEIPCWPMLRAGQLAVSNLVEPGICTTCGLCQSLTQGGRTLVVVPLLTADQTLGLLQVAFDRPDGLQEEQRRLLVAIAEMGGNALERARTMDMLEQLVQDRTRYLTALYEITRVTTGRRDLPVVLKQVLAKAVEAIGGQAGVIHLLDEGSEELQVVARHAALPGIMEQSGVQAAGASLWGQVVARGETIIRRVSISETLDVDAIGAPIQSKGHILGVLSLHGKAGQSFSVEDIALLAGVADHIGAAVESARLRQRAEEAAVLEERQRLARNLHDSVAQSLHSLTLSADTAGHLLAQNRPGPLRDSLDRLGESARQSLKEMRLLLYELQPGPLEQMNLVEVLQARLEAVEQHADVEARLVVDGPADWPDAWEGELYGIAMEALNNALKHARATRVTVRLRGSQNSVELEVADNGRGFDLHQRAAGGMGLGNMAERAERLGGELTIESAPGEGTRVRMSVEIGD